jgi:hypothetical protein
MRKVKKYWCCATVKQQSSLLIKNIEPLKSSATTVLYNRTLGSFSQYAQRRQSSAKMKKSRNSCWFKKISRYFPKNLLPHSQDERKGRKEPVQYFYEYKTTEKKSFKKHRKKYGKN